MRYVLEDMLAEVAQGCLLAVSEEVGGGIGDQDLLTPSGRIDARSEMDSGPT
jgi:hypothetical protein